LLERAVVYPTQTSQVWSLKNGKPYFFSRLDSTFWVKVEKEYAVRISNFVELAAIMSILYDMKQRFYISEKRNNEYI